MQKMLIWEQRNNCHGILWNRDLNTKLLVIYKTSISISNWIIIKKKRITYWMKYISMCTEKRCLLLLVTKYYSICFSSIEPVCKKY